LTLIEGFVFDLDGTVYLGDKALPGAVACLAALRSRGKKTVFVTNKPLEPRNAYASKLTRLGIPTGADRIVTSALVLGRHLARTYADLHYYLVGEDSLRVELRGYGLQILDELTGQDAQAVIDPTGIDAVIVAFDRTLDYRKLNTAYQALLHGARFFASNADKSCPMPGGAIPDAGATIAALEHITGRRLEVLAGKPSPLIVRAALEILELPPECCMMVGDRIETDIRMGQQAGMSTALVLTGASRHDDVRSMDAPPDLVIDSLEELPALVL
jgi:NagD protein